MPRKAIITPQSEAFLETYLNNASPTSFEAPGQKIWLNYLEPYIDEYFVDNYGTAVGVVNPDAEFRVVIEAHADEISWYVRHITDEGFIHVIRNGGMDQMIAPSMRVNIHTKKGIVPGIFGWPAIHTRRGEARPPEIKVKNMFIDVGARNKKEVLAMGINVGCVATYQDGFMKLGKNHYSGRALDNRAGGFMIAEVARLLHENKKKLPFGLYIVNAVQEEVGLRGAEMIANTIQPDCAIVTDVAHDTNTPHIDRLIEGDFKCGAGPIITYGPAVHNNLRELIMDVADKNKIPFQREVASRATGTDTDAFAFSNGGVPSALISLPLRYMHTTVETAHKKDIEDSIMLMYHTLLKLTPKFNFKYL